MTPKRTEPSAYLCPREGQPRLQWTPARHTDIRILFRKVRAQMRVSTDAKKPATR